MNTIKTMRAKDAARLAQRLTANPTPEAIEDAAHVLRLFYRFAAAYSRSFYVEQNRNATAEQRKQADAKSERAYKRASDALKPYGLRIDCPGLYPIIDDMNGANFTYGHYYN